jgi:CubicO group peptidase (beta-lactamase class C family)
MNSVLISLLATQVLVTAEPAKASEFDFSKFDEFVTKGQKLFGVPGLSYALIKDGQIVHTGAVGVKQVGKPELVNVETVYQIGSISKSFTAVLNGISVDEGKFDWTTKVVDIDPTFMMSDPWVTRQFQVVDTMAQRSGQKAYATDFLSFLGLSREEIRHAMRHTPMVSSFRSEFAYVNNMWLQAARLSELVQNDTWENLIQKRIFDPLKMTNSTTTLDGLFNAPDHAIMHTPGPKGPIPLLRDWPFGQWPYIYGPAGGINSNVLDMANYLRMHMNLGTYNGAKILERETANFLHEPQTIIPFKSSLPTAADTGRSFYAQGLVHSIKDDYTVIWHNGGTTGCKAIMGFSPELKSGIIVLSNLGGNNLPEAMMYRWLDMVAGLPDRDYLTEFKALQSQSEPQPPVRPKNPAPPMDLSAYTGTFTGEFTGDIEVALIDGQLQLRIPPAFHIMILEPWDRDTFILRIPRMADESESYSFVTFTVGPDGVPNAFSLDILDSGGDNLYHRKKPSPKQ